MKSKNQAWIIIAILTVVTALVWLAITVKTTLTKPTIPENLEVISKDLNPNLDKSVIDDLKQRHAN